MGSSSSKRAEAVPRDKSSEIQREQDDVDLPEQLGLNGVADIKAYIMLLGSQVPNFVVTCPRTWTIAALQDEVSRVYQSLDAKRGSSKHRTCEHLKHAHRSTWYIVSASSIVGGLAGADGTVELMAQMTDSNGTAEAHNNGGQTPQAGQTSTRTAKRALDRSPAQTQREAKKAKLGNDAGPAASKQGPHDLSNLQESSGSKPGDISNAKGEVEKRDSPVLSVATVPADDAEAGSSASSEESSSSDDESEESERPERRANAASNCTGVVPHVQKEEAASSSSDEDSEVTSSSEDVPPPSQQICSAVRNAVNSAIRVTGIQPAPQQPPIELSSSGTEDSSDDDTSSVRPQRNVAAARLKSEATSSEEETSEDSDETSESEHEEEAQAWVRARRVAQTNGRSQGRHESSSRNTGHR